MENALERVFLFGIEIVFSDFLECYRKELGERILKREISRRGMFEEDASAVTYHNFAAFSAGEENDIHRHLRAESQFVHGVCARRNDLSLVTFGNSLGNLIKTGIDDTQSQVRVCFRVAIDTINMENAFMKVECVFHVLDSATTIEVFTSTPVRSLNG